MEKDLGILWSIFLITICVIIGTFIVYHQVIKDNINNIKQINEKIETLEDVNEILKEEISTLTLQINEEQSIVKKPFRVRYGNFVGINYYVNRDSYHVILINGYEVETYGDKNFNFNMNERVMVIEIDNVLYLIPLREK